MRKICRLLWKSAYRSVTLAIQRIVGIDTWLQGSYQIKRLHHFLASKKLEAVFLHMPVTELSMTLHQVYLFHVL